MKAPAMEVADVMRAFSGEYLKIYGGNLPAMHRKTMADMIACRTPAMGGTTFWCPSCHHYQYSYHSCGNRNCNKCGNERAQQWLEQTGKLLLPTEHFLVTVTLPGTLRRQARSHQRLFYGLLMRCAAEALQTLGWDSRFVGGQLAMIGVLHTWGRNLSYHPHVHLIVAGGGCWPDGELWLASPGDFLMPVKAVSKIVAARFRDGLKKQAPQLYKTVDPSVWFGPWVVHSQPVGRGETALKYLATYIFRPAISNGRMLALDNNAMVSFRYQSSQTSQWNLCRLDALEFIRRYLQHTLPRGFVKVRYYGLYGHRHRERLNRLCDVLYQPASEWVTASSRQAATPPEVPLPKAATCRYCRQQMLRVATIPRGGPWPKAPPPSYFSAINQPKQTANPL